MIALLVSSFVSTVASITTCPGFPGFCSESFPGNECNVVCDFGRNNVPLCQEDGTWTDIPRCIEHEPGVDEQIPGTCPSVPGYCSQGFLNTQCKFDCLTGPDIDSICTQDGTWAPYPTCEGDKRETRDGCDGCPGPIGGTRNRTAEAIINSNTISDRRVPKIIADNGGRKRIPSFAGNINIGLVNPEQEVSTKGRFFQARPTPGPRLSSTSPVFLSTTAVPRPIQRAETQRPEASQPLTLFDRIKQRIEKGKGKKQEKVQQKPLIQQKPSIQQKPVIQQKPAFRTPKQPPPQPFQQSSSTFGVFEQVNLDINSRQRLPSSTNQNGGFFGVFPEVNLQN